MIITRLKLSLLMPYWLFKCWRAKVINKKSIKDENKYSEEFKWNYIIKRAKQTLKGLNITLEVKGYNNIPKASSILTPNHQSSIDPIVIVAALAKQTDEIGIKHKVGRFLSKQEVNNVRKLKGWIALSKTFLIDRKNPRKSLKELERMGKECKEYKEHIIIFPEGTRTKDGKLQEFKTGAFKIAKKEFMMIVPVTINNTQKATSFNHKKIKVEVIFGTPMKPMSFISQPTEKIAKRVKRRVNENYIEFIPIQNNIEKQV